MKVGLEGLDNVYIRFMAVFVLNGGLYSEGHASRIMRIQRGRLNALAKRGELKVIDFGGHRYFTGESLRAYLAGGNHQDEREVYVDGVEVLGAGDNGN